MAHTEALSGRLMAGTPAGRRRLMIAIAVGLAGALLVLRIGRFGADFDQLWAGARALRAGLDPYESVGPGRTFEVEWGLGYPLTAVLIVLPFSYLPVAAARAAFFGLSASLLTYALTRTGYHRLTLLASLAFLEAAFAVQWSPALTAAALLPWAGFVFAAKPNIALALFAAYPSARALAGSLLLVAATLAVMPTWPVAWWEALRTLPPYRPIILQPGGALLLLALLRWRRPEARLLVTLASVPQTGWPYEVVPLFLVPTSARESRHFTLLTSVATIAWVAVHPFESSFEEWLTDSARIMLALVYLPALLMVLRRPNEGELPSLLAVPLAAFRRRFGPEAATSKQ